MEFRGTKGRWLMAYADMRDTKKRELVISPKKPIKQDGGYRVISTIRPISQIDLEDKYNAKLISKAPEMLNMLKKVHSYAKEVGLIEGVNYLEIEKLIKESTKL